MHLHFTDSEAKYVTGEGGERGLAEIEPPAMLIAPHTK